MDKDTVIKACPVPGHGIENLHKKFCRSLKRSMFYESVDVARNMFGIKYSSGHLRKNEFWAQIGNLTVTKLRIKWLLK